MPLAWAHAEHVKLMRSLADGRVFDTPPQAQERYQIARIKSPHIVWRFNQKSRSLPRGKILRIELGATALVHWTADGWRTCTETPTRDSGFGMHVVDLPTTDFGKGTTINFTFYWSEGRRWEGVDYQTAVV